MGGEGGEVEGGRVNGTNNQRTENILYPCIHVPTLLYLSIAELSL